MSLLDWPTGDVTGWRWESIDTVVAPQRFATFVTEGDHTTLGAAMASFPDGSWSAPARCWLDPTRRDWRHKSRETPVEGCVCGYRVCRTIQTAYRYLFPHGKTPQYTTNPLGLVLVRVETRGKLVANDYDANLGPWNCVSANQIRPVWPAFVIDDTACRMLRQHYGTQDIHRLPSWSATEMASARV